MYRERERERERKESMWPTYSFTSADQFSHHRTLALIFSISQAKNAKPGRKAAIKAEAGKRLAQKAQKKGLRDTRKAKSKEKKGAAAAHSQAEGSDKSTKKNKKGKGSTVGSIY